MAGDDLKQKDAVLAFVLTLGAGLCTCLGAAVVYKRSLIEKANGEVLAMALSLAAGVMLYVSFVEIFVKSQTAFVDAGLDEGASYAYATLCFFGGIAFNRGLDFLVHRLEHKDQGHERSGGMDHHDAIDFDTLRQDLKDMEKKQPSSSCFSCGKKQAASPQEGNDTTGDIVLVGKDGPESDLGAGIDGAGKPQAGAGADKAAAPAPEALEAGTGPAEEESDKQLVHMGAMTALAIGLHNFPEGLATFIATLDDPAVGGALAIAIAIHNIPEGLCVAVPVYYATDNRNKAFCWAFFSGITEPIGAAFGWIVLYSIMNDIAYAVIFGLVAGMMVNICINDLLPTAIRYDPQGKYVSTFVIIGMVIMSLSLVLFVV